MLHDVRVVDLLDGMGAYASRLLIGLGAEVIKVEPPGGSPQRRRSWADPPGAPGVEELEFLHYYAGAKSVTLDPDSDVGRRQLDELLQSAGIVLDNGHLTRWGFDLDVLAGGDHPRVIVSVTPFGLDGPRAHWLGTDLVCQAMSGMLGLFGYYDERPARFGPEQASQMAGLAAASGALVGLFGARHGAGGEVVDIAVERVCAMSTFQMWNASIAEQFGFRRDRVARTEGLPSGVYEAADGHMAVNPWREPERMLTFLEQEGAIGSLRELRAEVGDVEFPGRAEADTAVREVFRRYAKVELLEKLQSAALIGLPVNNASDLLSDPFLLQREYFVGVVGPNGQSGLQDAGPPVRLSRTPYQAASRMPAAGEHNAEVLAPLAGTGSPASGAARGKAD